MQLQAQDHVAVRRRRLEQAVAIAEAAGRGGQVRHRAAAGVEHLYRFDELAELPPVGADVLHRRGAYPAGDERQVLQSRDAVAKSGTHQLVPRLAGPGGHAPIVRSQTLEGEAANTRAQRHAGQPCKRHDVRAASNDRDKEAQGLGVSQRRGHALCIRHVAHLIRRTRYAQGVGQLAAGQGGPGIGARSIQRKLRFTRSPTGLAVRGTACL